MNPSTESDQAPRDPAADRDRLRAIHSVVQSGDLHRAATMADEALAAGLRHPLLLNLSAWKLENAGRLDEAVARLRAALELAPDDVSVLNALGLCLNRLEDPESALKHFDAVIRIAPDFAPGYANRATALEAIGALDKAMESHRRALELQPGSLAAMTGLASIHQRRGENAKARELAQAVLEKEPQYPEATMTLAATELADGDTAGAERRLRAFLDDPRPSPLERAMAMGLLGDVLDERNLTLEAFNAYSDGNMLKRRLYAGQFASGPSTIETLRWVTAVFEKAPWKSSPLRAAMPDKTAAKGHVFLLGFPRSGTTLLEQVLASHPEVEALEEKELLIDASRAFMRQPADLEKLLAATELQLHEFREAYWQGVHDAGAAVAGKVFVDKHPLNTIKLPVIARLFPEAKILFAVRDPRDVVFSCFRRRFRMSAPMYELLTLQGAAEFYDAAMQLGIRVLETSPLACHFVHHENVVANFEHVVTEVCKFAGLQWTDQMRDFSARVQDRSVATPSAAQLALGLNSGGVGQWRRYSNQMQPVLPLLQRWVKRFGYPPA